MGCTLTSAVCAVRACACRQIQSNWMAGTPKPQFICTMAVDDLVSNDFDEKTCEYDGEPVTIRDLREAAADAAPSQ